MYRRRIKVFLTIISLILLGLLARLGYLQLVRGREYLEGAEEFLRRPELLPAMRGRILDRKGRILAIDEPCFDVCLDYRFMTANERWFSRSERIKAREDNVRLPIDARWVAVEQRRIGQREGISPEEAEAVFRKRRQRTQELLRRIADERGQDLARTQAKIVAKIVQIARICKQDVREMSQRHPVIRGLSEAAAGEIRAQLTETVGMEVRPSYRRRYPRGDSACHIIGLTGQVSRDDMAAHNLPENQPDWLTWRRDSYLGGDRIGIAGIEKMCEQVTSTSVDKKSYRGLRGRRG